MLQDIVSYTNAILPSSRLDATIVLAKTAGIWRKTKTIIGGISELPQNKNAKNANKDCMEVVRPMHHDMYYDYGNAPQYFIYDNKVYTHNTEIQIKQSYRDTNLFDGYKIWSSYKFQYRYMQGSVVYLTFAICNKPLSVKDTTFYAITLIVSERDLPNVIESITKPLEVTDAVIVPYEPKKDWEVDGMGTIWCVYLLALFGSLLFKQWYLGWMFATIIFIAKRKEMLQ
jgi:hypothetical protein